MRLKGGRILFVLIFMSTLREFSQALYDFHKEEGDKYKSIESLCKESRGYFFQKLKEVDDAEFKTTFLKGKNEADKKQLLISEMDNLTEELNKIIKRESDNDLEAPKDFYDKLFCKDGTEGFKGMTVSLSQRTDFYRIRKADYYTRYDRKGMFLISDDKEHLVGAYRFNPSGYACLYLASNLYLAWEECRRPDFDTFNFSWFVNTKNLEVLDLTIQNRFKFLGHFIMAYLTLLCCAKTEDKDNHHFQYVVPQLLMKVLSLSQRMAEKRHVKIIDGIRYLSSKRYDQKDFLFQDKSLSIAYVFPQHPHTDNKVCPTLARMFKLSEPRTYFLYKTHSLLFETNNALVSDYQNTLFYQLEQLIKRDKLEKIQG